ncbi:MAG: hypothetical protein H0X66_19165 [Verrucomicrobia bacterium]|nr:hypothetical protein [Verrucomicrobiota bacterium]
MDSTENKLPDLQNTLLNPEVLEQLFRDIERCTEIIEIIPKVSAGYVGQTSITLEEARAHLLSKQVRAVQIRYQYEGAQWWDTIMAVGDQFRLVRIEHNFG